MDRPEIWREWLSAAETVARCTKNRQAKEVWQFLTENGTVSQPHFLGFQYLEANKARNWFAAVPIMPGDEGVSQHWQKMCQTNQAAAHFLPDMRAIIVKPGLSPLWRGILLLHEGNHARSWIRTPYDWQDQQIFSEKERDTHTFQNHLMEALGGQRYRELLHREVQRILTVAKEGEGPLGSFLPTREEYNPEFDEIFDPAESEFDQALRQTHFWLHAVFNFLETYFKGDVERQKALVLWNDYSKNGIFGESART